MLSLTYRYITTTSAQERWPHDIIEQQTLVEKNRKQQIHSKIVHLEREKIIVKVTPSYGNHQINLAY